MLTLWGPTEVCLPVVVLAVATAGLAVFAYRRGEPLAVFPSLSWLIFIQIPFVLQASGWSPAIAREQGFGIAIVAGFLLAGDLFGVLYAPAGPPTATFSDGQRRALVTLAALCAGLVVFLPVYHVLHVAHIPLLDALRGTDATQTAQSREQFSKLLALPHIVKIAFQWGLTVFGPLLIALLFLLVRRKTVAILAIAGVFLWLFGYAVLSTAKQPFISFTLLSLLATASYWGRRWRVAGGWLAGAALVGFAMFGTLIAAQLASYHNRAMVENPAYRARVDAINPPGDPRGLSIADVYRISKSQYEPFYEHVPHYLVYRMFLTPVEVAYHWYGYFPEISGGWRALPELAGRRMPETPHAANRVGVWAYLERFPQHFLPSLSAYTSLDADARSFGGLPFVGAAGFVVLCLRVLAARVRRAPFGPVVSALLIGQIGMFAMSASVQAILVAQGAGLLVLLAMAILLWDRTTRADGRTD